MGKSKAPIEERQLSPYSEVAHLGAIAFLSIQSSRQAPVPPEAA